MTDLDLSEMGEFWLRVDEVPTAGTLIVRNGSIRLELVGCFPADRAVELKNGVGFPRRVPASGAHPIVCGVLRNGRAVTLVNVHGSASPSLHFANGVMWQRNGTPGTSDDATLSAEYAVFDCLETEEPTFDGIEFSIQALGNFLGRSRPWHPTRPIEAVHGLVPLVIPQVPPFEFELTPQWNLKLSQHLRTGRTIAMGDLEQLRFTLRANKGRATFSEGLPQLRALKSLAEFVAGSHQPLIDIIGVRSVEGTASRERFQLTHWWVRRGSVPTSDQTLYTFAALRPPAEVREIDQLPDAIVAQDPDRARFLTAWCSWFGHTPNADTIDSFVDAFHDDHVNSGEDIRSTVGALEHLATTSRGPSPERSRTSSPSREEIRARRAVIDWLDEHVDDEDFAIDWALGCLRNAESQVGLRRRLRELIDGVATAVEPVLRSSRAVPRDGKNRESADDTAKTLTRLRGSGSHGTGRTAASSWRSDQARLLVVGVVLAELGVEPDRIRDLTTQLSVTERWWRPVR